MITRKNGELKLTKQETDSLTTSLHYCTVEELKEIGSKLDIKLQGKKANFIAGIMNFITTGKQLLQESIPGVSRKQPVSNIRLHQIRLWYTVHLKMI